MDRENPYSDTFKSTRFHPIENGTEFVNMLKQTTSSLILDLGHIKIYPYS